MSIPPEIRRRWNATAKAAGVRLTPGDIDRIVAGGLAERVVHLEELLNRLQPQNDVPDYLRDTVGEGEGNGE